MLIIKLNMRLLNATKNCNLSWLCLCQIIIIFAIILSLLVAVKILSLPEHQSYCGIIIIGMLIIMLGFINSTFIHYWFDSDSKDTLMEGNSSSTNNTSHITLTEILNNTWSSLKFNGTLSWHQEVIENSTKSSLLVLLLFFALLPLSTHEWTLLGWVVCLIVSFAWLGQSKWIKTSFRLSFNQCPLFGQNNRIIKIKCLLKLV